jgi:hypothetical protein
MATVRDKSGNSDAMQDYAQMTFAGRITPSHNTAPIVPSNTAFIHDAAGNRAITKAVFAEGAGEIFFKNESGLSASASVADGGMAYIRATQILATTTATGLIGYF